MRNLKWKYIDWKEKQIILPKEIIKVRQDLIIPMSNQVKDILLKLKKKRKDNPDQEEYVFHSLRSLYRPISDATPTATLSAIGIKREEQSAHGFRTTASTLLREELDYSSDAIETQLSHALGTKISRVYNRAKYIEKRTKMMQDWADWLDKKRDEV